MGLCPWTERDNCDLLRRAAEYGLGKHIWAESLERAIILSRKRIGASRACLPLQAQPVGRFTQHVEHTLAPRNPIHRLLRPLCPRRVLVRRLCTVRGPSPLARSGYREEGRTGEDDRRRRRR
jgi:hypothetical protein